MPGSRPSVQSARAHEDPLSRLQASRATISVVSYFLSFLFIC
jgi:hypothetical protein